MSLNASVQFFEVQFQCQAQGAERVLNPFEQAALPHLQGQVLDFGCLARERGLAIQALEADLRCYEIQREFDAVACIGLLMFFDREAALRQLAALQHQLRPGGVAAVNVLIEGTTFTDMFDPACHCLMAEGELAAHFAGWQLLRDQVQDFAAPGGRIKRFATVVARKPIRPL
jgi:tellurite methyltransferase